MKLTINWLKDYIIFNDNITVQEICDKLTEIGLECETKLPNIKQYDNIIVAKIIETKQHPNADKLKICKDFLMNLYY